MVLHEPMLFDDGYAAPSRRLDRIPAAQAWADNGELVADLARVGHLDPEGITLDATYGPGVFWSRWRPRWLVAADRNAVPGVALRVDCRQLPFRAGVFDQAVFDPPYVPPGGRDAATAGLAVMYGRYGQLAGPRTPAETQDLIYATFPELHRVLRPGGVLAVKCQNYVSGGRKWPGVYRTLHAALLDGFDFVDEAVFVGHARPQPHDVQQHLASNYSTMLVLRKGRP